MELVSKVLVINGKYIHNNEQFWKIIVLLFSDKAKS